MVVTTSSMVEEGVGGLEWGADDYIGKPFAFVELAARIRAVLRRGNRPANAVLTVADLAVDRVGHTVQRGGTISSSAQRNLRCWSFSCGTRDSRGPGQLLSNKAGN